MDGIIQRLCFYNHMILEYESTENIRLTEKNWKLMNSISRLYSGIFILTFLNRAEETTSTHLMKMRKSKQLVSHVWQTKRISNDKDVFNTFLIEKLDSCSASFLETDDIEGKLCKENLQEYIFINEQAQPSKLNPRKTCHSHNTKFSENKQAYLTGNLSDRVKFDDNNEVEMTVFRIVHETPATSVDECYPFQFQSGKSEQQPCASSSADVGINSAAAHTAPVNTVSATSENNPSETPSASRMPELNEIFLPEVELKEYDSYALSQLQKAVQTVSFIQSCAKNNRKGWVKDVLTVLPEVSIEKPTLLTDTYGVNVLNSALFNRGYDAFLTLCDAEINGDQYLHMSESARIELAHKLIWTCIEAQEFSALKTLLEKGEIRLGLRPTENDSYPLLGLAAAVSKHKQALGLLITEHKADINLTDKKNKLSSLMYAICKGASIDGIT